MALHLVQGPAGSGKSQTVAEMVEAGEVEVVADTTRLWVALGLYERGPDGRYPVRADDDPVLAVALYAQGVAVRRGLDEGTEVAVTTSRRGQETRWRLVAEAAGTRLKVRTVDPGEDVVRARLAEPDGTLSAACERAIGRWYL